MQSAVPRRVGKDDASTARSCRTVKTATSWNAGLKTYTIILVAGGGRSGRYGSDANGREKKLDQDGVHDHLSRIRGI